MQCGECLLKLKVVGHPPFVNALPRGTAARAGAGEFTLPGVVGLDAQQIPAKNARKGINPFTKEKTVFKAKDAVK